jgi:hypothetical protein
VPDPFTIIDAPLRTNPSCLQVTSQIPRKLARPQNDRADKISTVSFAHIDHDIRKKNYCTTLGQ